MNPRDCQWRGNKNFNIIGLSRTTLYGCGVKEWINCKKEVEECINIPESDDEIRYRSELYFVFNLFIRQDKIILFLAFKEPDLCFKWLEREKTSWALLDYHGLF